MRQGQTSHQAAPRIRLLNSSVYLGYNTEALANGDTDEIVIGYNAVGIGSYTVELGNSQVVATQLQGNVGIGTFNPFGGGLIVTNGNVGIASLTPGQKVDVQGTVRALYFVGNGAGLTNISAGGWSQSGNNVYETLSGNVGIGTTLLTNAALTVMNGNVGVGTWVPSQRLAVTGGALIENQNGAAADTVLIGDPPLGGYPGIWLGANAAAPAYANYSFLSDGSGGNLFNAASGQLTRFRINNAATLTAGGAGVRIFGADTGNPADVSFI